jgi:ubiquinone/menaquinone biosynthesis C-methylase UbiE
VRSPSRSALLPLLACPQSGEALEVVGGSFVSASGRYKYRITDSGIPLFAEHFSTEDARMQQRHYDRIAAAYTANLNYPHTLEYLAFLDRQFLAQVSLPRGAIVAEICCGRGEAVHLLRGYSASIIGVDISLAMLERARAEHGDRDDLLLLQGDATRLPLKDASVDAVVMLGGVHHIVDRRALFGEIARVLKPGGHFYFREPVSDFWLWQLLRAVIYRLSPTLDHRTERPLRWVETVPLLEASGLRCAHWSTHGFIGFCLFMNSDVLVFNRLFRFVPAIRKITALAARLDQWALALPGMRKVGLQVIGIGEKPA